jgi:hypothetical protein
MENLRVVWTEGGRRKVSAVAYDRGSAEHRMARLRAEGATDVEAVSVKPGETVEVEQPPRGRVVQRKYTTSK